ncbi:MAG: hypothetical protein JXR20_02985 [Balneola sp.]
MNDYSDIIFLTGAMIIFSTLSLNTVKFFNTNDQIEYQSKLQYNGIAVAQDKIEEIRWIADEDRFKAGSSSFLERDYPSTVTQTYGDENQFEFDYTVNVDVAPTSITGSNATNYRVTVLVSNSELPDNQTITTEYIKSFGN